jgi:uncharacterized membrane protein YcaP (DUF421 family)
MFSGWKPLIPVFWHTLVIYLFLIAMFRILGRRQLGQLNVIDLVIIILMGSAVETAMVAGNTSLPAGLVCAATLLGVNRLIAFILQRSRRWRHIVSGSPILLVQDGQFIDEHLRRTGLTRDDVLEAIREREKGDIKEVKFAVMEVDGTITVIPGDAKTSRTAPVVRSTINREGASDHSTA